MTAQEQALRFVGAVEVYSDSFTRTVTKCPELDKLSAKLQEGDTLVVTKLDRIARSLIQGIDLIQKLLDKGIVVHILSIGIIDNSPTGKLITIVLLAFAEFERDMIVERTKEGKSIAKQNPSYREGRPKKYSKAQIQHTLELLGQRSYKEVEEMKEISKRTLIRAKRQIK